MKNILNKKILQKFLQLAGDKLTGEWVLIGGTVLPLLEREYRATLDIDLAGISEEQGSQTLQLMEIAEELGLPVETINQAGAFFLRKQKNFRNHLILLYQGSSASIFRPDVTLFLRLKISRLTESDLMDCLEFLDLATELGESLENEMICKILKHEIQAEKKIKMGSARLVRLETLLKKVKS